MTTRIRLLLLFCAPLLFAASAAAVASAETLEEMTARAKDEKVLNLFSNQLDYGKLLAEGFARRHPFLKVNHRTFPPTGDAFAAAALRGPEAERADAVLRCQIQSVADWKRGGALPRIDDLPNWDKRPRHLEDDAAYVYFLGAPHVIVYNTDFVSEEEAPRSYEELVAPKWKGKVALRNPLKGNSGAFLAEFTHEQRGLGWYSDLARNGAWMADTGGEATELVDRGERPVALSRDVEVLTRLRANPKLKMRFADGVVPYQFQLAHGNATAPHPAAGRLFLNWLLSEEAQKILEDNGYSVGARQAKHLAENNVWHLDIHALYDGHDSRIYEAAGRLFNDGAVIGALQGKGRASGALSAAPPPTGLDRATRK